MSSHSTCLCLFVFLLLLSTNFDPGFLEDFAHKPRIFTFSESHLKPKGFSVLSIFTPGHIPIHLPHFVFNIGKRFKVL